MREYVNSNNLSASSSIRSSSTSNPFEAMHMYKNIIRDVAKRARNMILELEDLPDSRDCTLNTCSRAVMNNDVQLAMHLHNKYSIAREVLLFRAESVSLKSSEILSLQIERARHKIITRQVQHSETIERTLPERSPRKAKIRHEMSHLALLMRQWVPISKFITVAALIQDDESYETRPNSIIEGFCKYWCPFLMTLMHIVIRS